MFHLNNPLRQEHLPWLFSWVLVYHQKAAEDLLTLSKQWLHLNQELKYISEVQPDVPREIAHRQG